MENGLVIDLGKKDYKDTIAFQDLIWHKRTLGFIPNTLIMVEHPPVYTIGVNSKPDHLKINRNNISAMGIKVENVDRGGSVTFHGFGQVVGYPIIHLDVLKGDVNFYLRLLEELIIRVLGKYKIRGNTINKLTGVWINNKKVAAIGVACRKSVMIHGFALNVNINLDYFSIIKPCGLEEYEITSMEKNTDKLLNVGEIKRTIKDVFPEVFGFCLKEVSPEDILKY